MGLTRAIIVFAIFFLVSKAFSHHIVYIYAVKKIAGVPSNFYFIEDSRELCKYKKVIIYGAESFKESLNHKCDDQKRIVAAVLYINYFYHPKYIYVSPLPSLQVLKRYGNAFSFLGTDTFSFYVSYLRKELKLEVVSLKNWFELERALKEVKRLGLPLLLLPDPVLMDERAQLILKGQLKDSQIRVINLIGKPLNLPYEVIINPFQQNYFSFIQKVYFEEPLKEGSIFYWE
ncbi:MAG: hypothetical protein ACK4Y7_00015 [Caldimicrobium sp.]